MPVDTLHPLYAAHERKAQRVRDAVAGSDAIKGRDEEYLPCPTGPIHLIKDEKDRVEALGRYETYIQRAVWLGVTERTHDGMVGAVFRKEPQAELETPIEYMMEDCDGSGMSLTQFSKLTTSSLITNGRHGILVDYPEAEDGLTRDQTRGLRATFRTYHSSSIINWRREGENLTLVVLHEWYDDGDDEFEREAKEQYRVLSLTDGHYLQRVFRDGNEASRSEPRDSKGNRWTTIPFQFLGTVNNDETPDKPLLLALADVNIAHYRNSADLEESSFIAGQPMFHINVGETTTEEWNELNPNGITVGSRRGVQTKNGSMELVQAEPNNLPNELMVRKEAQMLAIGARLIEQKASNETAEGVRARSGAENANLSSVATNVSDGIENCLEWALAFMSKQSSENVIFKLNQQFYEETADPQMIAAMITGLDRGVWAKADVRDWSRKRGLIAPERTDEVIDEEVQTGGTDIGVV